MYPAVVLIGPTRVLGGAWAHSVEYSQQWQVPFAAGLIDSMQRIRRPDYIVTDDPGVKGFRDQRHFGWRVTSSTPESRLPRLLIRRPCRVENSGTPGLTPHLR